MKLEPIATSIRQAALSAIVATASGTSASAAGAQPDANPIPRLVSQDGRYALFVDGSPFLILGVQSHNSSAWPAMFPKVWPALEYLHASTLEGQREFLRVEQFATRDGQKAPNNVPSNNLNAVKTSGRVIVPQGPRFVRI